MQSVTEPVEVTVEIPPASFLTLKTHVISSVARNLDCFGVHFDRLNAPPPRNDELKKIIIYILYLKNIYFYVQITAI